MVEVFGGGLGMVLLFLGRESVDPDVAKAHILSVFLQLEAFVGGAISAFMIISLFLAFLAMENHSRAIRRATEVLAER